MPTSFSTFDTTSANIVADIKSRILLSSDWSNPTGSRMVCTTTRGSDMVVDLADAAATNARMQLGVYRTQALADKLIRYIGVRGSGGSATDPMHVVLSAGKDHLFISIEGPRSGEPNEISTGSGSGKQSFFLGDIVPYNASDTVPAVFCSGNITTGSMTEYSGVVSRNQGNTASWVPALLSTLTVPTNATAAAGSAVVASGVQRYSASAAKTYMFPYVVFENADGIRGRLAKVFHLGWNFSASSITTDFQPPLFQRLTYNSENYITVTPTKNYPSGNNISVFGKSVADYQDSVVIAIPTS